MILRSKNQRSAFTLIELLLVIAIVTILAVLLLASVAQAKVKAQRIQCLNNLHQLGAGLQNFLANNHGYISWFAKTDADYSGTWMDQMERHGLDIPKPETNFFVKGMWRCPSAQFGAWSKKLPVKWLPSYYAYNAFGLGNAGTSLGLSGHHSPNSDIIPIHESEVIVPSDMMAIADSFEGDVGLLRENLNTIKKYGNTLTRHQGKANVVFCDGHVESTTLQFLFEDTRDAALSHWNRDHLPHREKLLP